MTYTALLFDVTDGIANVTVNRPDRLNALNAQVIAELDDVAQRAEREGDIRAVLLTGAGQKAFVAGADIGEVGGQGAVDGMARPGCTRASNTSVRRTSPPRSSPA